MILAQFGMIHPNILAKFDISAPVAAFELFLDAIPPSKNKGKSSAKPPLERSDMQKFTRDFAFILDEQVTAEKLIKSARSTDKTLIDGVEIFDVYYGDKLPAAKKSLALRVTIAPNERAMTDDEITALEQKIIAAVKTDTGGELRG